MVLKEFTRKTRGEGQGEEHTRQRKQYLLTWGMEGVKRMNGFIFPGKSCTADLQSPRVIHSGDVILALDDGTS